MLCFKKAAVAAMMVSAFAVAQADVIGAQSHTENGGMRVGTANHPRLPPQGGAGIGVDGQFQGYNAPAAHFANENYQQDDGSYHFSGRQIAATPNMPSAVAAMHEKLGIWTFAQAGTHDVWFGEWDKEDMTAADPGVKVAGTHTVWYVGQNGDVANTKPTVDGVKYTVRSINPNTRTAESTITANFADNTASSTGDIAFGGGKITTADNRVQLGASGVDVKSSEGKGGTLSGDFFGTGAAAVAGIVKFGDRNKDTAFGGTKK